MTRKNFFKKVIVLTMCMALVALQGAASCKAANIYNNKVVFVSHSKSIKSMSFDWDGGYSITSNQQWNGVISEAGNRNLKIVAEAGRSNSETVANWFNALAVNATLGLSTNSNGSPSGLHFAFSGMLNINGSLYKIVLGQGDNENGNNWWLGGTGLADSTYNSQGQTVVNTFDGRYQFAPGNNNYTFVVTAL